MNNTLNTLLLLLVFSLVACTQTTKKEEAQDILEETTTETIDEVPEEGEEEEAPILLGIQQRSAIEAAPYDAWFTQSYADHPLDEEIIEAVKSQLSDAKITVFMGTWCEDSQREVPAFFKILDKAGIDSQSIELITVSRDKDTPEGLEEGKDITNVPTFIFSNTDGELGRIVEYPIESLEKDMQKILTGEEYKHAYAE